MPVRRKAVYANRATCVSSERPTLLFFIPLRRFAGGRKALMVALFALLLFCDNNCTYLRKLWQKGRDF
jgi:hypothetical protein